MKNQFLVIVVLIISFNFIISIAWENSRPLLPTFKWIKSFTSTSVVLLSTLSKVSPAYSFGPINMELTITDYRQVDLCNGKKPMLPGEKAAEGLFPICIEVEADIVNPEKSKTLTDVSVYGYVKEDTAGNSVLANNPDFRSDAGQYAMISKIIPGKSHITYQFIAAISTDPKVKPIPKLSFSKTKAVSFPGGEKFRPLDVCELDPFSCDTDE